MGVHSGKFALVNGVDTMRDWSINDSSAPARGVASNTRFAPIRRHGVRSWNGSFFRYGMGVPVFMPGDQFTFEGYTAPTTDVEGTTGVVYSGLALLSQLQLSWNWANGELLSQQYTFAGHLELSYDDAAAAFPDVAVPDIGEVCGTKIQYQNSSGGSWVEVTNLMSAQLTLSCSLQSFVNSSTVCWTGQKAGPIDWTLSVGQQDDTRVNGIFDVGEDVGLRLFVDNTLFWELLWGHVRDFTGISVNRESGAIIGRSINFDMNAASGTLLGSIKTPDAATWWPPA